MRRFILVSGLSGAGRTTALKTFEDLGFYCIDNLPAALLPSLVELLDERPQAAERVVVGVDVREGLFWKDLQPALEHLQRKGARPEILYLEAAEEALIRRFSATRRRPPLASGNDSVEEGLRKERELLGPIRAAADRVIDTTGMSVHDLRAQVVRQFGGEDLDGKSLLAVTVLSFSYRNGIPPEANFVFDVRFLPNPYWNEELKDLDGRDSRVFDYVMDRSEAREFAVRVESLLQEILPSFVGEGRSQLVIAFGCTGGQHRSVALARWLEDRLAQGGYLVRVRHRELPGG